MKHHRSVNASIAYGNGEVPKSKINKEWIYDSLTSAAFSDEVSEKVIANFPLSFLKSELVSFTCAHHVGDDRFCRLVNFYGLRDFYYDMKSDEELFSELSKSYVEYKAKLKERKKTNKIFKILNQISKEKTSCGYYGCLKVYFVDFSVFLKNYRELKKLGFTIETKKTETGHAILGSSFCFLDFSDDPKERAFWTFEL